MTDLHRLAAAAGLQVDWRDAHDRPQRVADDALIRLLGTMGHDAQTPAAIAASRARIAEASPATFASVDVGEPTVLPRGTPSGAAELRLDDGTVIATWIDQAGDAAMLPAIDVIGYHDLRVGDRSIRIAVAPPRARRIADLAGRPRIWGPAVQISSLRDVAARRHGDFTALAHTAAAFAAQGADAIAISPVHALFPADSARFSPYAPSSRLFSNILLADPATIAPMEGDDDGGDLIDWQAAIPRRLAALRVAFAQSGPFADEIAAFRVAGGIDLVRHALFDALLDHFHDSGASGWRQWPAAFHDPDGAAVTAFAAEHEAAIDFYVFAQWLAARGLTSAQRRARAAGMAIGLIADLAVGMDPGGSHAWSRRDDLLDGLSIGAPPDLLGPDGQNWGITGFRPDALLATNFDAFIATLRAALDHAGGIRIDHALGLRRLWVVPQGVPASEGAYLTYPMEHMLRILAIESHRADAVVIGEDLGTVPEGLRPALRERAVMGMQVLWFEKADDRFVDPRAWRPDAAAMTGTHDLATVAGWWTERDIDWTWALGRTTQAASQAEDRAIRAHDRGRLWEALCCSGAAQGDMPAVDDPAPVVDAALDHVARTPCEIAILPMEDVIGLREAPNLPGTIDEHPNWRRRMPDDSATLLGRPEVVARLARVAAARS